jgi:serine/threonine protein kinase
METPGQDAHVRELKPGNMGWKQQVVGSGSFGKVYRARWRGREVAVKELRLPQETDAHASGEAKIMLSRQLQETVEEFTAEISERAVCLHLCGLC